MPIIGPFRALKPPMRAEPRWTSTNESGEHCLVVHLAVDIYSEEDRPGDENMNLALSDLTAPGSLRPHHGLRHGVPVQLGDLHLHTHIFRHLEVDVGVAPVSEVSEGPGGVAELVRGALRDDCEGVQPGVGALLPHLQTVVGRGGQPGHWAVNTQSTIISSQTLNKCQIFFLILLKILLFFTSAVSSNKNTRRLLMSQQASSYNYLTFSDSKLCPYRLFLIL